MKLNYFTYCILLLIFTQCLSQNNENMSEKPEISKSIIEYKNKTWPQYKGPNGDRKVDSEFTPSKNSKISWEFEYKGGKPTPLVIDNGTSFFGTDTKDIYAIDSIGNLKWKIKLDNEIKYSLAISNNVLVAAPDSTMIYGINSYSGEIIWKRNFSYEYKSYISDKKDMFGRTIITDPNKFVIKKRGKNEAPPLIYKDQVFITTYEQIVALDIKTGKTEYILNKKEGTTGLPLITDDYIYTTTYNHLYSFDKLTSKLKWKINIRNITYSSPTLYKENLYINSRYDLHIIDRKSGIDSGLSTSLGSSRFVSEIIDNDIYYYSKYGYHTKMGINYGSSVIAHDLNTDKKIWDFNTRTKDISPILMVGDYLYYGDSLGHAGALYKENGEKIFDIYIGGSIRNSLCYSNGVIYGTSQKDESNVIFTIK